MAVVIPDPRWEMPELLTPGRKPTGNVVIDWSNPLSRGLKRYWLLNGFSELIHGTKLIDQNGDVEFLVYDGSMSPYLDSKKSLLGSVTPIAGAEPRTLLGEINHSLSNDGTIFHINVKIDSTDAGTTGARWTLRWASMGRWCGTPRSLRMGAWTGAWSRIGGRRRSRFTCRSPA